MEFSETVELSGVPKETIFNRASSWIHEYFHKNPAIIKIQDKSSGVVFGEARWNVGDEDEITFSISIKAADGQYTFVFHEFYHEAGSLDNPKPECCVSSKQWVKIKGGANAHAMDMVKNLKDRMKSSSASDAFVTVPLIDTSARIASHAAQPEALGIKQPSLFYFQIGGADAVSTGGASPSSSGFGGRHGGTPSTVGSVYNYHAELGLFLPSRSDKYQGFSMAAGYMGVPLTMKVTSTSYATGNPVQSQSNVSYSGDYIELKPGYSIFGHKSRPFNYNVSFGLDLMITATSNFKDLIGPFAGFGYRFGNLMAQASFDYSLNSIYGASSGGFRGGGGTTVQPIFLGLGVAYYPKMKVSKSATVKRR